MGMRDINKDQAFTLRLRVDRNNIFGWLIYTGLVFFITVVLAGLIWNLNFHVAARGMIVAFLAVVGWLEVVFAFYLLRLIATSRNRMDLNSDGMVDYASFCALGVVKMPAIDRIRFLNRWGSEFLVISFTRQAKTLRRAGGFKAALYRSLIGERLWIPLHFFEVSRLDLESQIIHLNQMRGYNSDSVQDTSASPFLSPSDVLTPVPVNLNSSEKPPPVSQVTKRDPIRERVQAIKQKVKESGFDYLVAQLYLDYLSQFPVYAETAEFIPPSMAHVNGFQKGSDYEEVSFHFKGVPFQFGLRRDIGASNEALLSVGVHGKVQMSLRVRVEIGVLDPIDLESFKIGQWQDLTFDLKADIEQFEAQRMGRGIMDDREDQEVTMTRTNLEDLKSRFGLDED